MPAALRSTGPSSLAVSQTCEHIQTHTPKHAHAHTTSHGLSGSEHLHEHLIPEGEETGGWRVTSKGLRQGRGWRTLTRRPRDGHAHTPAGPSPRSGGQWICCCPRSEVRTPGEVPGPGSHVWASESSSRPPFPSRYLAKSFLVTSPTTCGSKARSWESSGPTPPL